MNPNVFELYFNVAMQWRSFKSQQAKGTRGQPHWVFWKKRTLTWAANSINWEEKQNLQVWSNLLFWMKLQNFSSSSHVLQLNQALSMRLPFHRDQNGMNTFWSCVMEGLGDGKNQIWFSSSSPASSQPGRRTLAASLKWRSEYRT